MIWVAAMLTIIILIVLIYIGFCILTVSTCFDEGEDDFNSED
jgi:hypothetical protein